MVDLQTLTTFCISPGSIHNFHNQRNLLSHVCHLHFHYRVHLKEYTIFYSWVSLIKSGCVEENYQFQMPV